MGVGEIDEPMIGDRDTMRVPGQIMQNVFGAAEGPMGSPAARNVANAGLEWKQVVSMNRTLLWITVAVVLMIALLFYRSRRTNLNVDPHAREEIETSVTWAGSVVLHGIYDQISSYRTYCWSFG